MLLQEGLHFVLDVGSAFLGSQHHCDILYQHGDICALLFELQVAVNLLLDENCELTLLL